VAGEFLRRSRTPAKIKATTNGKPKVTRMNDLLLQALEIS
jgi:hypothetical protein